MMHLICTVCRLSLFIMSSIQSVNDFQKGSCYETVLIPMSVAKVAFSKINSLAELCHGFTGN